MEETFKIKKKCFFVLFCTYAWQSTSISRWPSCDSHFSKTFPSYFFTCSCLKINKTSTWIGGRVVIIRNQAGSGSWGSGGHWEPALPEASSENKGFFLKFKTASLPFLYWDSDDGTFCLKVYWGKVVDKQEGSVSQWINNQKEFFSDNRKNSRVKSSLL